MKTIYYVAGKSGGHIVPALTLAQQQHKQESTICGIFTTDAKLDAQLVAACSAITHHISLKITGVSFKNPLFFLKLLRSFLTSGRILYAKRPAMVVSTGGLVSVPVCVAAWIMRIPFELHEFNVEPGAAIKFLAPYAHNVYVSFEATKKYLRGNIRAAEYPVRYAAVDRISFADARAQLNIPQDRKILMILGGSQGSRFFNTLVQQFVMHLSEAERTSLYIIHQTGVADALEMTHFYKNSAIDALVFAYRDDIALCYQAADYIVTRAGAGALHELLFFKKRALIVPLEVKSTSHQISNAQAFIVRDPILYSMVRQQELQADCRLLYSMIQQQL